VDTDVGTGAQVVPFQRWPGSHPHVGDASASSHSLGREGVEPVTEASEDPTDASARCDAPVVVGFRVDREHPNACAHSSATPTSLQTMGDTLTTTGVPFNDRTGGTRVGAYMRLGSASVGGSCRGALAFGTPGGARTLHFSSLQSSAHR